MYNIKNNKILNFYDDYPSEKVYINLKDGKRFYINYIYKDEEYLSELSLNNEITWKIASYGMAMCLILPSIFISIFMLNTFLLLKILISLFIFVLLIIFDKYNIKILKKKYSPFHLKTRKVRNYKEEKEKIINILKEL